MKGHTLFVRHIDFLSFLVNLTHVCDYTILERFSRCTCIRVIFSILEIKLASQISFKLDIRHLYSRRQPILVTYIPSSNLSVLVLFNIFSKAMPSAMLYMFYTLLSVIGLCVCVYFHQHIWSMKIHIKHKNIARHTAHTIVSWPDPKQWVIVHTSEMMTIRQSIYSFNHHKGKG